jgi:aminomethyltransferase
MPDRALLALQGPQAVDALARLNAGVAALTFMTGGVFELAGADLLRHALGLHRRGRLRDLGAGRPAVALAEALLAQPEVQTRRPGRARHAAPGGRPVPVRPRHRHHHQPGRGRPDLGHPEGAPPRRRARRRLPRRQPRSKATWPAAPGKRVGLVGLEACRCAKAPPRRRPRPQAGHGDQRHAGPTVNQPIAMAYLPQEPRPAAQHEVFAEVRGKRLPMRVTPMPFAPHRYAALNPSPPQPPTKGACP